MKRQLSSYRQPWMRTAIYSFMTLIVTVIVALLMLVVLGYQFNKKDGRIEQGGLLQFESIPTGAVVTLDQLKEGSLTNTKATVDRGNHYVTYDLSGYRQWQKSITISAGQIGWLSYARLIPNTITPQTVHDYPSLSGALAAPSRHYILLHEAADSPAFTLVNIQGDTPQYSTITLPAASYTAPSASKTQTFTLDSWSQDDNAVLIRHTYNDGQTEWILLDRNSPEKSVNITATYGITPSKVLFAGEGSKLLFVRTDDIVRRINLDEQTLSRPLATKVDNFSAYDEKTIIYSTTADEKNTRTVSYAAIDVSSPVILETYPADGQPLYAAMTNYFGQRYVAVAHGRSLVITTGTLPALNSKGTMTRLALHTLPEGISDLESSTNNRFFVSQVPDGFTTYDIELNKYDTTTWASQPQAARQLNWLDQYMLWSDYGGELRFYEFDGANQQTIMPVAEGYDVSLSTNNKYVYAINKTDKGYQLERAKLILN